MYYNCKQPFLLVLPNFTREAYNGPCINTLKFQVGDTIWPEFSESEDHIVPYPKGTEENRLLTYGDYNKKQKTEENTVFASTEQTARSNTDYQGCHVENQPVLQTNGELSAPQLELESWPDLPSLDAELGRSYNNESDQDSMATAYLNDFNAVQNLDKVRGNMTVL